MKCPWVISLSIVDEELGAIVFKVTVPTAFTRATVVCFLKIMLSLMAKTEPWSLEMNLLAAANGFVQTQRTGLPIP